ncbi:MAG: PAS domain-containing sensor histidine kinase [Anaerolineae bacterium]|nr:PAS domain-containing sensor histidine kinase [Anaerolineae bacterium]
MTNDLPINRATLSLLQERALRESVSVDDLLSGWLAAGTDSPPANPASSAPQPGGSDALTEARLRSLVESQTTWVIRTDTQGRFTYMNPAWLRTFGRRYDLSTSISYDQTTLQEDEATARAAGIAILRSPDSPVQVILRKLTADGRLLWTLWELSGIRDETGAVTEVQCIGIDITERHEAERLEAERNRLRASLKAEREYNNAVQQTIFSLEHDVRSSLGAIAAAKQMLSRYYDRLSAAQRHEKFAAIDHQLQHVTELLDEMKHTVKGHLSLKPFNPSPVNLAALCHLSVSEIQETVGAHLKMHFTSDGAITTVIADEVLISRILLNLLSNAAKYSPPDSEVCLELRRQEGQIDLRVIDHGIGIGEDDLGKIFDPFYRSSAVGEISGTGLGLSIVKECVERHHGNISVQSQVGAGTTFTIRLPLALTVECADAETAGMLR